jgi:hypothetical protein
LRRTIRSAIVIASVWSWVTYTVVVPMRLCSLLISVLICTLSLASRLERGSSMRKAFGSRTIARPRATRWRWPPESAFGLRSRKRSIESILAASSTRRSISSLFIFLSLRAKPMLSRTFMCGYRA